MSLTSVVVVDYMAQREIDECQDTFRCGKTFLRHGGLHHFASGVCLLQHA
jgi:hypothetical protein